MEEQCPLCQTEMRVIDSCIEVIGDNSPDTLTQIFEVINFSCRNQQCPLLNKIVPGIRREKTRASPRKLDGGKYCCDELLTYITQDSFSVSRKATNNAHLALDGTLTITCPVCGEVHKYDVSGKQEVKEYA